MPLSQLWPPHFVPTPRPRLSRSDRMLMQRIFQHSWVYFVHCFEKKKKKVLFFVLNLWKRTKHKLEVSEVIVLCVRPSRSRWRWICSCDQNANMSVGMHVALHLPDRGTRRIWDTIFIYSRFIRILLIPVWTLLWKANTLTSAINRISFFQPVQESLPMCVVRRACSSLVL